MKKIISLLLLLAMLTLAFASCGSKTKDPAATTAEQTVAPGTTASGNGNGTAAPGTTAEVTTAEPTTVVTTTDKWEVIGPTVSAYADRARTFKLEFSNYVSAEKASKNDQYMAGPDEVEPGRTPALEQFVYERNKKAKELLNVNIVYDYWDYSWGKAAPQIKTVVQGQAEDAPDLFVNMSYDINIAILAGAFKDTWSLPGLLSFGLL